MAKENVIGIRLSDEELKRLEVRLQHAKRGAPYLDLSKFIREMIDLPEGTIKVRLPEWLNFAVKDEANGEGRTIEDMVVQLIAEAVQARVAIAHRMEEAGRRHQEQVARQLKRQRKKRTEELYVDIAAEIRKGEFLEGPGPGKPDLGRRAQRKKETEKGKERRRA